MVQEEHGLRVAYLGPMASYTHQAALDTFPQSRNHTLTPVPDIPSIFQAVQSNNAERGVIPFENSTNGSVVQTLDLLADSKNQYPNIQMCGEAFVRVQHYLLGRKSTSHSQSQPTHRSSPSGANLRHVKSLYSHPQAWTQCTPFLSSAVPGRERHDTSSTSRAAEIVAADKSGSSAAICSALAAELYGLDVLAPDIEEKKGNMTRFLIIRNSPTTSPSSPLSQNGSSSSWKSLLSFTLPQTGSPGALAQALAVFGKYGINLTSMNSRPSGERPWHYIFFIEFQGRRGDGKVDNALAELQSVVARWKTLGTWMSNGGQDGG
ncbi:PDT-domain-containing protein [Tothia fuscella]|uniref:prephenate dehydratase n=1 Tax=Tothia fuscella TaxID=1048955 RepID=A0A9P4NRH4_9PEZI|nr:PDT-domain-containing protein [Tothia fuscella]